MTFEQLPEILTVEEVADLARTGVKAVYKALRSGELFGRRIGPGWRIPKTAVRAWLEGTENEDAQPHHHRLSVQEEGRGTGRSLRAV